MRAIVFDSFGGPEVLSISERLEPAAGPGEVVVAVTASTVNPTDLMMRRGEQAALMKGLVPPFIGGMEFSGHVREAGAGVALRPGTRVIGVVNPRTPRGGAWAERIVVPAASVVPVGEKVDLVGAATVPMNALTASMALDMLGLLPGEPVLVTGGAGVMGGFAIALARRAGLVVVANAGPADAALVTELGARHVVPRDSGLAEAVRALFSEGVAGLVDGALIGGQVAHLVRDGGSAVSLRRSHPIDDPRLRIGYVSVTAGLTDTARLALIARLIGEGVLVPRIAPGGVFPFPQAADAHRLAGRSGLRGRVVLTFA